ncbi:hypothetical protein F5Y04DRAFT_221216 [Hypomontagnella monticulosa]|nr:hypothetical protein F5Y04DRAFT_221216 [Hypomontagnella monticulosa]
MSRPPPGPPPPPQGAVIRPPSAPRRDPCVARGCEFEVERRGQIASRFCARHTCQHFWEPLLGEQRCQNEKPPGDSVCFHHIRCQVPGCTHGRMQEFDPRGTAGVPQYRRQRYCSYHKCAMRGCPNVRIFIVAINRYDEYCDEHTRDADVRDPSPPHKRPTEECIPEDDAHHNTGNQCGRATCNCWKQRDQTCCGRQCKVETCPNLKKGGSWQCVEYTYCEKDCNYSSGCHNYCDDRCGSNGCIYFKAGPCYCPRYCYSGTGCPGRVNYGIYYGFSGNKCCAQWCDHQRVQRQVEEQNDQYNKDMCEWRRMVRESRSSGRRGRHV